MLFVCWLCEKEVGDLSKAPDLSMESLTVRSLHHVKDISVCVVGDCVKVVYVFLLRLLGFDFKGALGITEMQALKKVGFKECLE
ncbi:hypothetical protein Rhal01_02446 [Rubritalea halochordaticola]|uniref:Uncharacterized protein n=1 Tax=Rubritalea halochordaticola TaxID=714537 RepID=A0ABP9V0P2_9BACT